LDKFTYFFIFRENLRKNFQAKIFLQIFLITSHFSRKTMPSKCLICASWFSTDVSCCEACDELEDFKNLCGNCSGVGPYNQRYVPTPRACEVMSIESANYERMQRRKQEAEEQRIKTEKLMANYRV
jgi:hypothetical protein